MLTLLFALHAFAAATPECSLNFADLKGALETEEKRDELKKTVTQTAALKSGEKVTFRAGGCEHMAFSYELAGVKWKRNKVANAFTAAEKALSAVSVRKDDSTKKILLHALKQGAADPTSDGPGIYPLPCGSARCTLDVRTPKTIQLTYDMAL